MKPIRLWVCLTFIFIALINVLIVGTDYACAQDESATPTASEPIVEASSTATLEPEPMPTVTPEPPSGRPQIVVASYHASEETVHAGYDFDLEIRFRNDGASPAENVNIVFAGDNFYVRETGGVWSISELTPGDTYKIRQPLTASWSLAGYTVGTTTITANYTDENGTAYSDIFLISFDIYFDPDWGKPTPTPVLGENPQIVVRNYHIDVPELKPGATFALELEIANLGSRLAKGVGMVIAGNSSNPDLSSSSSATISSVPFAALDSSNLIHIGDLNPGEMRNLTSRLIVDLQASAGVYSLPLAFQYSDETGQQFIDEQVVTLIVQTTPQLKISFYETPGEIVVGATGVLPLQVINMGYQTALLGDLHLKTSQGTLSGETAFIGQLESGSSFSHDAEVVPESPGELVIEAAVEYNDVFGQPQNIVQTLTVQVIDDETLSSDEDNANPVINVDEPAQKGESFWHKVVRFFKTFLGLGG